MGSYSKLRELDWSFPGDKSDSPFSDLHFHPGRFVPQIPAALIGTLTQPRDVILDPFCGSGTTLVEAQRLGRNAIGIDLNPIACLISRVKTQKKSAAKIEEEVSNFLKILAIYDIEHRMDAKNIAPPSVQLSKWYHPETGRQLVSIWSCIQSHMDEGVHDLALFCFSATLMASCGETRHWGYICDNVRPLQLRYVDAYGVFADRAKALIEAFRRRDHRSLSPELFVTSEILVKEGDATAELTSLGANSVDLVVTSPPYFGVVDYIKAQRLTFEWFGIELEAYRRSEIGARSKRHRLSALTQYLDEIGAVVRETYRVLKVGCVAAFVLGESGKREGAIAEFVSMLNKQGFETEIRVTRTIGRLRRQPASLSNEELIICRKL